MTTDEAKAKFTTIGFSDEAAAKILDAIFELYLDTRLECARIAENMGSPEIAKAIRDLQ